MTPTVAHGGDRVAASLEAHGVRFLFTLCGGHISPILVAAKARHIRVIDVRHEATAVFAADAVARRTGIPGVAAVTAGPGVTNTITALKNAQLAQSPVILLGGAAPTALQGRGALQDIDQKKLVTPHVKRYIRVARVADLGPAVDEAFFEAQSGVPGPVFVECPVDLLYDEASIRQWYADAAGKGKSIADRALRFYLNRHANKMFAGASVAAPPRVRRVTPTAVAESALARTLTALKKAERPLMVLGSQAVACMENANNIVDAATRLGIPVYLSGMARGSLGRDHPLQFRHQRRQALREADCVILAGVPCDFRLDYGRHVRRSATLIAANRSSEDARLNRVPDIAAIGDAGLFLKQLAERAPGKPDRWDRWMDALRSRESAREVEITNDAKIETEYVNAVSLFRTLDELADSEAILVADGGDFVATASYIVHPRAPLSWLDPGAFGTLGVGAGYALGAALCHPGKEVWIIWGDGACGYGLTEFDSFVRHSIPVIAVVGNDASWSQIAREQVKMLHDDVATVLARTAYHEVAAAFGASGMVVRRNDELRGALNDAKRAAREGRPVLINVWLTKSDFREGSISM